MKAIGRELGVRYVLDGSVRKAGNRVRVTAQLIEATAGGHLWAERYDRDLADIFAVQDEITTSVSTAILPSLERSERERAARKPPDSLDAWECYHRGLSHFSKFEAGENALALRFFGQALELDPGFAAAIAHRCNNTAAATGDADQNPGVVQRTWDPPSKLVLTLS